MAVQLLAQELQRFESSKVRMITHDDSRQPAFRSFDSYLTEPISGGGGNEFELILGDLGQGFRDQFSQLQGLIGTLGFDFPWGNQRLESLNATRKSWKSSNAPDLVLKLLIVEFGAQDNSLGLLNFLSETYLPDPHSGLLVNPPLNFHNPIDDEDLEESVKFFEDDEGNLRDRSNEISTVEQAADEIPVVSYLANVPRQPNSGGVRVKISRWFDTLFPVFIVDSVSWTASSQVSDSGRPLAVQATVNLSTFRMMTRQEVQSWYIRTPDVDRLSFTEDLTLATPGTRFAAPPALPRAGGRFEITP